jgi:membrane protease YdiL (CAAX protease family)
MKDKDAFTKILAIAGTLCVWFPVLAPVFFSIARLIEGGRFMFDYLMPAELFPLVLIGGGMLIWAAVRAKKQRKLIGWGLGVAVGLLLAGQGLAVLTGLASGEMEPTGWQMALVVAVLILYSLGLVAAGVGGVLLLRDLYTMKVEEKA